MYMYMYICMIVQMYMYVCISGVLVKLKPLLVMHFDF